MSQSHSELERELCFSRAVDLVGLVRAKKVSAREVMEAHLARIEEVDPAVNAIVTRVPERALEEGPSLICFKPWLKTSV